MSQINSGSKLKETISPEQVKKLKLPHNVAVREIPKLEYLLRIRKMPIYKEGLKYDFIRELKHTDKSVLLRPSEMGIQLINTCDSILAKCGEEVLLKKVGDEVALLHSFLTSYLEIFPLVKSDNTILQRWI